MAVTILEALFALFAMGYALATIGCFVVGLFGGRHLRDEDILTGGDRKIYR